MAASVTRAACVINEMLLQLYKYLFGSTSALFILHGGGGIAGHIGKIAKKLASLADELVKRQ